MVKDKNNKFTAIFILSFYFLYLFYDYLSWSDEGRLKAVRTHLNNTTNKIIDGLIVGGSNGAYSISASQMSESFQRQWYNFSLVMEGFSLNSYHKLLTSALTVSQREKISAIVITPRSLIVTSEVADRLDSDLPIQGKPKIDFRPKVSVLSFLKKLLTTRSDLEKIYNTIDLNQHGDKIFKTNQTFIPKILPVEINQIDQNQIERYVVKNVCFYKKHFPNANLYFVFPSGYYNQNNLPILINSANYISNTVSLNYKYNVGTGVRFIVQPPYTNIAQLHDTAWHASETGRHWRTLNLINALSSIKSP